MNRQINWNSGALDEIELVYEKAEEDETIGKLLEELELQALAEAQANCGLLRTAAGCSITSEEFSKLPMEVKEQAINALAGMGLASISQDMKSAVIFVRLSAGIQQVMACTVFDVLNRLEKLDGALNVFIPKWTLELQVPLGEKKGLFRWEMLIMQLYPWISIRETPVNQVASTTTENVSKYCTRCGTKLEPTWEFCPNCGKKDKENTSTQSQSAPATNSEQSKPAGESLTESAESIKTVIASSSLDLSMKAAEKDALPKFSEQELIKIFADYFARNTSFYSTPGTPAYTAYFSTIEKAKGEILSNGKLFTAATKFTINELVDMLNNPKPSITNMVLLGLIFRSGWYCVIEDRLLCVDFCEIFPNCIALYLLLTAQKKPADKRNQCIDAGEGTNSEKLKQALEGLKPCDPNWKPVIL